MAGYVLIKVDIQLNCIFVDFCDLLKNVTQKQVNGRTDLTIISTLIREKLFPHFNILRF